MPGNISWLLVGTSLEGVHMNPDWVAQSGVPENSSRRNITLPRTIFLGNSPTWEADFLEISPSPLLQVMTLDE